MRIRFHALLVLLFSCQGLWAFGLNKVQYEQFRWSFVQTKHFDIYFPQNTERVAQFAATHVEKMYSEVSGVIGHRIHGRIPIILHSSHAEFQQTNVIRLPLHESIGGFTEIFKNRVVMPFEGDYKEFYHVLQHELVHAVMFDRLFGSGPGGLMGRAAAGRFPLWVDEGLAEYASQKWDLQSEFFMLDATTFGYVASPVHNFGGFLAYKGGQLFFYFMEQAYGKESIPRFIQELFHSRDVGEAFKKVTHMSLEEAGEIWLRELRFIYWPELGKRQYGKTVARQLTKHGKDLSFYNLQPTLSPDGEEIAFFSDRATWEGIYVLNTKTEKVNRLVIQGGRSGTHESFHSFKSGMAWSPDGKRLAIVSKSQGKDVIHIIDSKSGRVRDAVEPDVQAIRSPDWSRDGRLLAFSGMNEGLSDIYLWDFEKKETRRLTRDLAYDDKPVFSPSGAWLAFETNRGEQWNEGDSLDLEREYSKLGDFLDIYRIDLDNDSLSPLVTGPYDDKMPSFGPDDSSLIFVSNRSGVDNMYLWRDSSGTEIVDAVSNLLSGCFTPSWSRDGKQLAFSLFEQGGWDVFLMKDPLAKRKSEPLPETRYMQSSKDSSLSFFRPIPWANLASFSADSAKKADSTTAMDTAFPRDSNETQPALSPHDSSVSEDTASLVVADSTAQGDSAISQTVTADALEAADPVPDSDDMMAAPKDSSTQTDSLSPTLSGREPEPEPEAEAEAEADSVHLLAEAGSEKTRKEESQFIQDSTYYLHDDGSYRVRDYRPIFSLDMASAALGYDNFYGAAGMAYVTLSDLMGDQEISFVVDLNGDKFSNANGLVSYHYLPMKWDYSLSAFHRVFGQTQPSRFLPDSSYKDRIWGFGGTVRMPQNIYDRWQFDLQAMFASRTRQIRDGDEFVDDPGLTPERVDVLVPRVSWHHDNTLWGIVGPVNGERMEAGLQVVPPLFQDDLFFYVLDADLRKYWQFFKKYTLALRFSGGLSDPVAGYKNPHSFLVGGDNFLNLYPLASQENAPRDLEEQYLSDLDFPVRGYKYYQFKGTRKLLLNLEFRYPFIREFTVVWPIPLSLRNITGVLFSDYGGAWSTGNAWDELGWGYGFGMRINLGVFVLRYTRSWSVDEVAGLSGNQRDYWSLGAEF